MIARLRKVTSSRAIDFGLIFVAGVLVGLTVLGISGISVDFEISLGDVLTLILTIVLAILVSKTWRDSQFKDDSLRSFVGGLIDELRSELMSIHAASLALIGSADSQEIYRDLVPRFRNASNIVYEINSISQELARPEIASPAGVAILNLKRFTTSFSPSNPMTERHRAEFDILFTIARSSLTTLRLKAYSS